MSGRGRGRGRGSATSLNREQLAAIGVTPGENFPGPITEPPPLYPTLNRRPVPLLESLELDYLIILRQHFLDHMQTSGAYLRPPSERRNKPQQKIDKLLAQLPSVKEKFDWNLFPVELRPKVVAKRFKQKDVKEIDVESRLNHLEKIEEKSDVIEVAIKEEIDNDEEDVEMMENYEDEEVDDGTDYANNYFDNGEAYEDEDDNLDDGPIY